MARFQVVSSLSTYMSLVQAHALEHACQTFALSTGSSYERTALKCLYLFQHGLVDEAKLLELGPQALASVPLECFVSKIPAKEAIAEKEDARGRSAELLRDLTQGEEQEVLPDSGVRCKKCGSNDVTHEFLQTRSADEGTTIFCTCMKCKKRWKM